jgi:hypothetical protein
LRRDSIARTSWSDNSAIAKLLQRSLCRRHASYSEAAKLTSVSETVALFI